MKDDRPMRDPQSIYVMHASDYPVEVSRRMSKRARHMRIKAHAAVEETRVIRAALERQVEELAVSNGFRRRYTTAILSMILKSAIEAAKADMGNIQLIDP